jgi:alanine racemase
VSGDGGRNGNRGSNAPDWPPTDLSAVPSHAPGVIVIDLGALRRNYRRLAALAVPAETAAVIKADAYGIGAVEAASALAAEGCATFFVASLSEAYRLRERLTDGAIYVLDGLLPGTAAEFPAGQIRPVLGSRAEIEEWSSFCRAAKAPLPAALHVDTGMLRLGISPEHAASLATAPQLLDSFVLDLVMSHLACADEPTHPKNPAQLARFTMAARQLPQARLSLANSAGILLGSAYHFDMVRPGIALYGGTCGPQNRTEPVATLYGRIAQVRWAERGETVSYGATRTLSRRTRIITVCAGYADGYFWRLSSNDAREGAPAFAGDHRLPLLGRVTMDLVMFDATGVPAAMLPRGGFVELLGEHVTVDDLAAFGGTIGYEVLTSLGRRFHRIYLDHREL